MKHGILCLNRTNTINIFLNANGFKNGVDFVTLALGQLLQTTENGFSSLLDEPWP